MPVDELEPHQKNVATFGIMDMKRVTQHLLAAVVLAAIPLTGQAATGRTAGSFTVSSTGAASYSIPIWSPPGPRGIQPKLTVVHDSGSGGGSLGVGWSVAGLSKIIRCNRIFAQDVAPAPVALTYNDAFCLDGKRLRLTSSETLSTYGQDGTTYQTEIADFSNITAHGVAGNGPSYFTLKGKDGLIYEYGNGGNSQVLATSTATAVAWMLNKVTDRANNTLLTIAYRAPDANLAGMTLPDTISWSPSSAGSTSFNYTLKFNYVGNDPQSSIIGYVAGTSVVNQNLLANITISSNGTAVRQYVFTYENSPTTGADRLHQIKECADAGATNCLSPTTITYQNGQAGTATSGTTAVSGTLSRVVLRHDFNGDGYPDLAYSNGTTWSVKFGSATGYGTAVSTGVAVNSPVDALFGDLLGKGTDGILAKSGATWSYYTWNGTAFAATSTGLAFDTTATGAGLADINGDGKPDLVTLNYAASGTDAGNHVYTRLNTSSTSVVSFSGSAINAFNNTTTLSGSGQLYQGYLITPDSQYSSLRSFDFNGDGQQDLAYSVSECDAFIPDPGGGQACLAYFSYVYELISQPGGTFSSTVALGNINATSSVAYFTNWNSDACTDVIANSSLNISGCNGSVGQGLTPAGTVAGTMDWDGDGRTDLVLSNGSTLSVQLSTGAGLAASTISTSIPCATGRQAVTLDANADGLDEVGCFTAGTSGSVVYYAHNAPGTPPDLVTSIADGYGVSVSPSYVSIASSNYTKGSGASYPEQDIQLPMYVVGQVTTSDGIGGFYTQTYTYAGARQNIQGRGFEGFQSRTVTDSRAGSLVTKTYFQTSPFPLSGVVDHEDVYQSDGATLVSHAGFTNAQTPIDSTANNQRYFVAVSASSSQNYEVGGLKNGQLITTTATTFTYDNGSTTNIYGNLTNVVTTVTDSDSTSPYSGSQWKTTTATTFVPDAGTNWCLNQPTQVAVTNSAPLVPDITRTVSYVPDYVMCRETQRTVEPGNATYEVVESYLFDFFSNIKQVTVTGRNMPARVTVIDWGATGQFAMSVKNPLNQTTQNGYDFGLGRLTSVTDPNGIATSWHYDAFGRKDLETRPDSTTTTWSYNDCTANGCVNSNNRMTVVETVKNTDGTTQTDSSAYLDQFDRTLVTSQRMLNGAYDRSEARYDSFGRMSQRSAPCTFVGCTSFWTTFTYDAVGRLIQTQRPTSATISTLLTTTLQYAGRTATVTDPQGKQATQITTVAGTLGRSQDHDGYYQNFSYDSFGSLLSVTDSLSNQLFAATYEYGAKPFQRTTGHTDLGNRSYTYDALGELTSYSDAKGQSFSMFYDALSRPTQRTEPDLVTTWTWGNTAASFNIGRLFSVSAQNASNGTYSEGFTYDNKAHLTNRSITIPSDGTYAYDFAYNSTTGLLDTVTYPTSTSSYRLKLQYAYQYGILQKVSDANLSTTVFWLANAMNPRGQVTQETLGNGVITNRSFDAVTGWMSSLQSGVGGTAALQNESYMQDLVGNITQRQNNNAGLTENFYYDNLYRLDHSTLGGVNNLQMHYDATGNISSRSDIAAGATWNYDPSHIHAVTQAGTGGPSYTYDANGNATTLRNNALGINWTSFNHPSMINGAVGESVQFAYDQNHERWRAIYSGSSGTETTYFVGGLLEKVVTVGKTDYRHYIFADGTKVAVYSRPTVGSITLRYIREDHEGGVSAIINSDGTSYVKESFTAFGDRRSSCTWKGPATQGSQDKINAATRHGYTWQTALGAMGLNDMNGRIQDAVTGRFLSPDPYVMDPGNTQDFNRYSYVNNNPLSFTDPSGFCYQLDCITVPCPMGSCLNPYPPCEWGCTSPIPPCDFGCTPGTPTYPGYDPTLPCFWCTDPHKPPADPGNPGTNPKPPSPPPAPPPPPAPKPPSPLQPAVAGQKYFFQQSQGPQGQQLPEAPLRGGVSDLLQNFIEWATRPNPEINGGHYYGGQPDLLGGGLGAARSAVGIGEYAGESIAARSAARDFTAAERAEINRIGSETGCHTCGTTNPGTKSGNFVPDHQPPSALNPSAGHQRLYPHCINCSREQGLEIARQLKVGGQ